MASAPPKVRDRYPTLTVSVGREEQAELHAAAERRGFASERGPLPGGLVRAILRRLWPFLRAVGFDPSRCDISPEHAWLLGQMRALEESSPDRWALVLRLAEECGAPMPAEMHQRVDALLPDAWRPAAAVPGARAAAAKRRR